MMTDIDPTALAVFIFFLALVTVMGFVAARWRRPKTLAHIDEWGLGGRTFGTWTTWFLVDDFYIAHAGLPALAANIVVTVAVNLLSRASSRAARRKQRSTR